MIIPSMKKSNQGNLCTKPQFWIGKSQKFYGCFVFSMVVVYGCGYNPINRLITSLLEIIVDNIPLFHMVVVYGCFLMVMPITYSNNSQYMKGRLIKI